MNPEELSEYTTNLLEKLRQEKDSEKVRDIIDEFRKIIATLEARNEENNHYKINR